MEQRPDINSTHSRKLRLLSPSISLVFAMFSYVHIVLGTMHYSILVQALTTLFVSILSGGIYYIRGKALSSYPAYYNLITIDKISEGMFS